jgi:hypothetical protein
MDRRLSSAEDAEEDADSDVSAAVRALILNE